MKIIKRIIEKIFRSTRINKTQQKLPKKITHLFICLHPNDTTSKDKLYYGYITLEKRHVLTHSMINIINDTGKHVRMSDHRFLILEL